MMSPRRNILLLTLLIGPVAAAQDGFFRLPDRLMSEGRIGSVSKKVLPTLPEWDFTPVRFAPDGSRPVSADLPFAQYLLEHSLLGDAETLICGSYLPSDTLSFLRAEVLFARRKLPQAAELFAGISPSSPFAAQARHYAVATEAYLGHYDTAAALLSSLSSRPWGEASGEISGDVSTSLDMTESPAYPQLTALQGAGIALLRGDEAAWQRWSGAFTYDDYACAESQRTLDEIASRRFVRRQYAGVAALFSAVIPGSGKIYAGRIGEGVAAFLTVGSLGAITAEQGIRHGWKDWRTLLAGSLCAWFYSGNIYGSYLSVSIENNETLKRDNLLVLYHLHIPLRSIFR